MLLQTERGKKKHISSDKEHLSTRLIAKSSPSNLRNGKARTRKYMVAVEAWNIIHKLSHNLYKAKFE